MEPEDCAKASEQISRNLAAWLEARPALRTIAVYAALPGEPDLRSLHSLSPRTALVYPLVRPNHRLSFHRINDPDSLVAGSFGIMEPDPARHAEMGVGEIDGFLCPGLAFDESGTRLGRGGGFYDRALEGARPDAVRVGVCYGAQIAGQIPREPHDIVMGHVACEEDVRPSREGSS